MHRLNFDSDTGVIRTGANTDAITSILLEALRANYTSARYVFLIRYK